MDISAIEKTLTEQYGAPEPYSAPGLDWLSSDGSGYVGLNLDHAEYRIKDGKKTVTYRPYKQGVTIEEIELVVRIAKRKHLHLFIERASNYNGGTILVILTEVNVHPLD